ncbi:lipoprotein-anchoring transpeptidase ErfK/SrfK [Pseudorhizobium tarimense]|uniref:Lipoprotein-anchoring transpeptidase ErfK/SrfK n=2 Tax=Pseudorhizobium tarimense TaxID=1079109 RepID=A0ABV2HDU2_9HYPH
MKNIILTAASLAATLLAGGAHAAEIQSDAVTGASLSSIPQTRPDETAVEPDPAIVHLQILLDRAGASPGVIDGFYGENVSKAVFGFETLQGLDADGDLDAEVLNRLKSDVPVLRDYKITPEDGQGLADSIPEDYAKMVEMGKLGYTSTAERLAERFHMDEDLLSALNPGSDFAVGETVSVADPGDPVEGKVARIEVGRKAAQVRAFSGDDTLLAVYPATIGSEENPAPSGTHEVKGVAPMPTYTYNPDLNFQQDDNTEVLEIAGGPNNPVGSVWIDLSEPTYGIHGTPEPALIDKVGSHGCVRLTNWDAEELGAMVDPGVTVEFIN